MLEKLLRALSRKRVKDEIPSDMKYLVVGLGNIGPEYASTRHNVGFMVLDAWAQASNAIFESKRYGSVAEISLKGRKITLLKPSTYMNLSGGAVRYWVQKLGISLENLLVICDDLNLPFGTVRMRKQGSDGGHNGLKNINEALGTNQWCRIRIGIGHEFSEGEQVDYVLGEFSDEDKVALKAICDKVIEGSKSFVLSGPDNTMNFFNKKHENV